MTVKPPSGDSGSSGEGQEERQDPALANADAEGAESDEGATASAAADDVDEESDGLGEDEPSQAADDPLEPIMLQATANAASLGNGDTVVTAMPTEAMRSSRRSGRDPARGDTVVTAMPADDDDDVQAIDISEDAGDEAGSGNGAAAAQATGPEADEVDSLLDEVAAALNSEAAAHRNRALGKLPGMTADRVDDELEFEDPDDGPTALTPSVIPVAAEAAADDDGVALVGAASERPPAGAPVSVPVGRSGPTPSIFSKSSIGLPAPAVGAASSSASATAAAAGAVRLRLPTPTPGLPVPSGIRLPTPLGVRSTMSALGTASVGPVSATTAAPPAPAPSLASRGAVPSGAPRAASDMAAVSGPTGLGGRRSQATERVMGVVGGVPSALSAHVKLKTVSLTGIVAATFAIGLFVGRTVWKDTGTSAVPTAAVSASDSTRAPVVAPSGSGRNDTTMPATTTLPAAAPGAAVGQPVAATAPAVIPSTPPTAAVIVTPVPPSDDEPVAAAQPEELALKPVVKKPRIRVRPPAVARAPVAAAPEAAPITAGRAPAARQPAAGSASKTMATTAPAKPAKKGKPAWHDPFAD